VKDLLWSWSFRIGLVMLLPIAVIVPWRRVLMWDTGDRIVVPLTVTRYGWVWSRPFEASIDITRLLSELVFLCAVVGIAYMFERSRLSPGS
jgi:hypothetical protein